MNRPVVRLEKIVFADSIEEGDKTWLGEGADGMVKIRVTIDCHKTEDYIEATESYLPHDHTRLDECWDRHQYLVPFVRGDTQRTAHSYVDGDGKTRTFERLRWGWDGSREAPTLHPSFLSWCDYTWGKMRFHIFFREGRIDLLSDSGVTLPDGRFVPMALG